MTCQNSPKFHTYIEHGEVITHIEFRVIYCMASVVWSPEYCPKKNKKSFVY